MVIESEHKEHRKRLRKRFMSEGLDGFDNINVLELLLTFSIPVRDTNTIAQKLLARYKNLSDVFDAEYYDLLNCEGVGESSAVLISFFRQLMRRYSLDKQTCKPNFRSVDKIGEYLVSYYTCTNYECVTAIYLNNMCSMIDCVKVGLGGIGDCQVDTRKVAEIGLAKHATAFILAHNHPDGLANPSDSDIKTTQTLLPIFEALGMPMLEHIVVAGSSWDSLFKYISKD